MTAGTPPNPSMYFHPSGSTFAKAPQTRPAKNWPKVMANTLQDHQKAAHV